MNRNQASFMLLSRSKNLLHEPDRLFVEMGEASVVVSTFVPQRSPMTSA